MPGTYKGWTRPFVSAIVLFECEGLTGSALGLGRLEKQKPSSGAFLEGFVLLRDYPVQRGDTNRPSCQQTKQGPSSRKIHPNFAPPKCKSLKIERVRTCESLLATQSLPQ